MNTSPRILDERRERIHAEAMALIEAERQARIAKTERLRSKRLSVATASRGTDHQLDSFEG